MKGKDAEAVLHDAIAEELKKKLKHQYRDIKINPAGEKLHEFNGQYPDIILSEHGMVLAVVEIETENSITEKPDKIKMWKSLAGSGARLILMVPKGMKPKLASMLWDGGLADKAALGSYEISINMP
ncbi:MAG: hypothetical protein M0Z75_05135 [Nitrospiraceae bacterium]|nr:hypothetical protein [Nitrospiraceae bacterium]MDA8090926.1 hypothetical protein [Nitrospiraceae bacterium]